MKEKENLYIYRCSGDIDETEISRKFQNMGPCSLLHHCCCGAEACVCYTYIRKRRRSFLCLPSLLLYSYRIYNHLYSSTCFFSCQISERTYSSFIFFAIIFCSTVRELIIIVFVFLNKNTFFVVQFTDI